MNLWRLFSIHRTEFCCNFQEFIENLQWKWIPFWFSCSLVVWEVHLHLHCLLKQILQLFNIPNNTQTKLIPQSLKRQGIVTLLLNTAICVTNERQTTPFADVVVVLILWMFWLLVKHSHPYNKSIHVRVWWVNSINCEEKTHNAMRCKQHQKTIINLKP